MSERGLSQRHTQYREPAASPRFLLLDFARFVAAFSVVMYHYTLRDTGQWPESTRQMFPDLSLISSYGYLGVQLFFIVSGFVIFMSTEGKTVSSFIASRVARIFPAYWLAVLGTACLRTWLAPELGQGPSFSQVLINLTMFQVPAGVPHVDAVYWTLWVELVFYVLIAVLMALGVKDRGYKVFLFLWPALMLLVTQSENQHLIDVTGAKYSAFFAVGMCLYLIHKRGSQVTLWLLLAGNVAVGIRNTLEFTVPSNPEDGRFVTDTGVAIVVSLIILLMIVLTLTPLKHKGYAWMVRAGALTYPLYLTHQYWGWWAIRSLDPVLGTWATLVAAIAFSIAIAYAIERWVERPVRPRMRRFVTRVLAGKS
ncbi:acyltransferase family protein [Ancrocorticia sp.]|uniref:acyltransferase family protein n=1 Tax=Ancrocorticia sp. TaxID=2593684 RepID=UPI003F9375B0